MSIIGRLLSSSGGDWNDPWPERSYTSTDLLRDWWVVDCWFHKKSALAAAHFDGFIKWMTENPPDSLPYLSWAPYTKVRVDLSCLKEAPAPELGKQYRGEGNRYYALALCYARNEHLDIEQYQRAWHESEEYAAFAQMVADRKAGWPKESVKVTPEWYHEMIVKTAGVQWLGYHGFEDRKSADLA